MLNKKTHLLFHINNKLLCIFLSLVKSFFFAITKLNLHQVYFYFRSSVVEDNVILLMPLLLNIFDLFLCLPL